MSDNQKLSAGRVFLAFLKFGLPSFGGPVTHLGYFRNEFLVAACMAISRDTFRSIRQSEFRFSA